MIRRAERLEELNSLPNKGIEAQKIRALQLCYGLKYDFCRFYVSDHAVIGGLDGSFVVCETDFDNCDYEELAEFFRFTGFSEIFCSETVGAGLSELLDCKSEKLNLMRFDGVGITAVTDKDPTLTEFYGILKTGFDVDFEPWYLDMSHRVRHGVTRLRRLGGSVLAIQHELNGEALLSQIVTLPEYRRQGNASRLISAVCAELSESEVFVLCEDRLIEFYQKICFSFCESHYQLISKL